MTVERPAFTRTRLRAGCDRDEVDAAVDRIMTGTTSAEEGDAISLSIRMYRAGYDILEVDNWLDDAAEGLGGAPRPRHDPRPGTSPEEVRRARAVGIVGLTVVALVLAYLWFA